MLARRGTIAAATFLGAAGFTLFRFWTGGAGETSAVVPTGPASASVRATPTPDTSPARVSSRRPTPTPTGKAAWLGVPRLEPKWTAVGAGHVGTAGPARWIALPAADRVYTDSRRQGVAAYEQESGTRAWLLEPEADGAGVGMVLLADEETVVVGGEDIVLGLAADTGRPRWRIRLEEGLKPAAAVESRHGLHVLLDRPTDGDLAPPEVLTIVPDTGAHQWRAALTARRDVDQNLQWGAHLLVGDRLVIQTATDMQALDTRTGRVAWVVPFAVEDVNAFTRQPIVVEDGTVFAADTGGDLVAVDLDSGDVIWRRATGERAAPVGLSPSNFIHLDRAGVHGLDPLTGRRQWTTHLPNARLGLLDGVLYIVAPDRAVAMSARGSIRWDRAFEEFRPLSVMLVDDTLVIAGEDGIHALDRRDGTPRWLTIDGVAEPPHLLPNGTLVVAHPTGAVALYDLMTGL